MAPSGLYWLSSIKSDSAATPVVPPRHQHGLYARLTVRRQLDYTFLGILLGASEQHVDPRTHKRVQDVVDEKLAVNAKVSERHKYLVEGLTPGEC
jgi:ABC-type Na+ transport system ATPase subunit NatA